MPLTGWEAVVIGVLQGLLEWVPVSSSGQLALLLATILGFAPETAYRLSIATHLGTAFSGAAVTRREILDALRLGPWLRIALIPLLVGAPIAFTIDRLISGVPGDLFNLMIGLLLIATTILVLRSGKSLGDRKALTLSTQELAVIGVLQGLAALPGLSRSATTMAGLLILGLSPPEAVRASIVMGTAATGAMAIYEIINGVQATLALAIALTAAFASGLISASIMIKLAQRYKKQIATFTIIIAILAILSATPALLP